MKKFINALDRIVGLAFFSVFAVIAILVWKYGSPLGIITQQVNAVLGAFVFLFGMIFDVAMFCWYCNALSHNNYKFISVLKSMLKLSRISFRISFAAIYNWLTAD